MGQKAAVRIIAGGVFGKVQSAGQVIVIHEPTDPVGLILFHASGQHLIGTVLGGLGPDGIGVQLFQQAGQFGHQQLDAVVLDGILLLIGEGVLGLQIKAQQQPFGIGKIGRFLRPDLAGVDDEHLGGRRNGQRLSVGVVDGAPGRVNGDVPGLAAEGIFFVKFLIDDLQPCQSADDGRRAQNAKKHRRKCDAATGTAVGFSLNFGHFVSFLGKTGNPAVGG